MAEDPARIKAAKAETEAKELILSQMAEQRAAEIAKRRADFNATNN